MAFSKLAVTIGVLLAGVQAQQAINCVYPSVKCGAVWLNPPFSYTAAQLAASVNDTASIPPLTTAQLSQTLFRCTDILGTLTGISYCFAGCEYKAGIRNDQCIV